MRNDCLGEEACKLLDELAESLGYSCIVLCGSSFDDMWICLVDSEGARCPLLFGKKNPHAKIFAHDYIDAVNAVCEVVGDSEEGKLGILRGDECTKISAEEEAKIAQWLVKANLAGFGLEDAV